MALVLAPEAPLSDWLIALDAQIERSPTFFDGRPVVVDLGALPAEQQGVADFLQMLDERGIRVIGTEGAHPSWDGVERWGRPLPGSNKSTRAVEAPVEPQAAAPAVPQPSPVTPLVPGSLTESQSGAETIGLLIDHPIRSGQSVVFERGDITVLGSVASGAEVMAGGSVHIYGTLRGRAIAGLAGNGNARIFCRKLQAELIAIDGVYQTADDMPANLLGKAVQAWLDGERMKITALD